MAGEHARDVFSGYAKSLIQFKARQLCRRPGFSQSDEDDLEQEMWLHLVVQAEHFDPSRASLNTFIDRAVCSCVAMILRARRRLKRAAGFGALSLESTMIEVDGIPTPACQVVSADDLQRRTGVGPDRAAARYEDAEAIAHALDTMSPKLREVCRRLMSGTISSTARELGTSRRQVRVATRMIRWHLEQAGFGQL